MNIMANIWATRVKSDYKVRDEEDKNSTARALSAAHSYDCFERLKM